MTALGPLDHISRPPLPWRAAHLTECGKPLAEIDPQRVLTREQVAARIKAVGQKRAAYTTCMTCADTSNRWAGRDSDQVILFAVSREVAAVENTRPPLPAEAYATWHRTNPQRDHAMWERRQQLSAEFHAIVALIEAHRDEFDAYLAGLQDTVKLADRRSTKRARTRHLGGAS